MKDFQDWVVVGMSKRGHAPEGCEIVESRPEIAEEFERQEVEAQDASGFYHLVPRNRQRKYGAEPKKVHFEEHFVGPKENHSVIPYRVQDLIVRILDENEKHIGHATLRGPSLCAFPKHFFDEHKPSFVHVAGKGHAKILSYKFDDPEANDCWCFAQFDRTVKYARTPLKVPTKRATGALCGITGFQPTAIDLNPKNFDIVYIAESNYKDCGFPVIDSEHVEIIGINAGIYENSGVAYALPVTHKTILCEQSFL
jgi:hypothetical protein